MCTEKERTVLMFWYQVKHCLLTKEKSCVSSPALDLAKNKFWWLPKEKSCASYPALDLAKEKFWWLKEISNFLLSTWNLYFRETMFVKGNIEGLLTMQVENLRVISYFKTKY